MNPIVIDMQPDFTDKKVETITQPVVAVPMDSHDVVKGKLPVPHCMVASEESQRQARQSCEIAERFAGHEN